VSTSTGALVRRQVPSPGRIPVERVARTVPRPGSRAVESSGENAVGASVDGSIVLKDRVVTRIASRAAGEIDGVGSAARRMLGVQLAAPGMERLGQRATNLQALPAVTAQVDGRRVFLTVTAGVAYPSPLRKTAQQVRDRVVERLSALTGLEVTEVDVHVTALAMDGEPQARVR